MTSSEQPAPTDAPTGEYDNQDSEQAQATTEERPGTDDAAEADEDTQ
ncbi:MAG TPA: hypothetical protein VHB69_08700 [Mycobacteriales bacterium]|nr:hypothetical protein [Mycobacteriales bacterium]